MPQTIADAFVLSDVVSGRHLGGAVLCSPVRYASIITADGIQRRLVSATEWPKIEEQKHNPGPVPADSAIARALLGECGTHLLMLQSLLFLEIDRDDGPEADVRQLDELLRSLMPPSRWLQE